MAVVARASDPPLHAEEEHVTEKERAQDRERWTKLVADYEASDPTQTRIRVRARRLVQHSSKLELPPASGVAAARHEGAGAAQAALRGEKPPLPHEIAAAA
jgi:hypothetical protein